MTGGWQLVQINVGRLIAPPGDPRIAEFVAALDHDQASPPRDMNPDPWCIGRA